MKSRCVLSYKTQTYCHMHLIRFIYRTGGDVRRFKILIAPPCDSLDSHRSKWSLHFVGFLIHSSASIDSSVSNITLSIHHLPHSSPPHFGLFTLSMVFLTLELCYLDQEILTLQNRWCRHWWAQFTVVFSPFPFLIPPSSAELTCSLSLSTSFKVTDFYFLEKKSPDLPTLKFWCDYLPSCIISSELLKLSVLQFPHL